jgi:transposase
MEDKTYRTYAEEFKLQALALLKRGEKSASEIERSLGITPGLLAKWKARYRVVEKDGEPTGLLPNELQTAKAEIRQLQQKLAVAEEERDILKKALSIFSRRNV